MPRLPDIAHLIMLLSLQFGSSHGAAEAAKVAAAIADSQKASPGSSWRVPSLLKRGLLVKMQIRNCLKTALEMASY